MHKRLRRGRSLRLVHYSDVLRGLQDARAVLTCLLFHICFRFASHVLQFGLVLAAQYRPQLTVRFDV